MEQETDLDMKYIDADLLRKEIEKRLKNIRDYMTGVGMKYKGPKYYKAQGKESAYDALLNTIDSLQQEQPKVDLVVKLKHHLATTPKEQLEKEWKELEPWGNIGPTVQEFLYGKQQEVDLEKEIETYFKGWYMDETDQGYILHTSDDHAGLMSVKQIARHFAEWGAEHLRDTTKKIDKSLEEEIDRFEDWMETYNQADYPTSFTTRDIARHFAEWQKSQMLKDAVEKTVGQLERQWGGNTHFMHGFEVDEMDFPFLNSQECGYGDKVRIIILKDNKDESK